MFRCTFVQSKIVDNDTETQSQERDARVVGVKPLVYWSTPIYLYSSVHTYKVYLNKKRTRAFALVPHAYHSSIQHGVPMPNRKHSHPLAASPSSMIIPPGSTTGRPSRKSPVRCAVAHMTRFRPSTPEQSTIPH